MNTEPSLPVVEIFASLQGEGANTGKEVVFLRLGGCNLACPWCDTDFAHTETLSLPEIVRRMAAFPSVRSLVVTGGEPLIHPELAELLPRLKSLGYWIAMESNGVLRPAAELRGSIDYLAVSPKALFADRYQPQTMALEADEVRIVVDGDVAVFCESMRRQIRASRYFLSPCERSGVFNFRETLQLLGRLNADHAKNPWLLSLQMHKLAGFR